VTSNSTEHLKVSAVTCLDAAWLGCALNLGLPRLQSDSKARLGKDLLPSCAQLLRRLASRRSAQNMASDLFPVSERECRGDTSKEQSSKTEVTVFP
jgi:hypothetical protein